MKTELSCIMLIDDNDDDNFYHKLIINEAHAASHIEVAENGFQALEYLTNCRRYPQLIFLDINMPAMNGWEFLEEYKKLDAARMNDIVIIILTTSMNPADEQKAREQKLVQGFETKPLDEKMLKRIIETHFQ